MVLFGFQIEYDLGLRHNKSKIADIFKLRVTLKKDKSGHECTTLPPLRNRFRQTLLRSETKIIDISFLYSFGSLAYLL